MKICWRRHQRRRTLRQFLDHRQGSLQLAAGQSRHSVSGVVGSGAVPGPARRDGRGRGAGTGRSQRGRQRCDPDHDRGSSGPRNPRMGSNNAFRVVMREGLVGLVNGAGFAVITGIAAVVWFKIPALGVVIGLAMLCNLIAGALGGILIPMVLDRVRPDPPVASPTFAPPLPDLFPLFSFSATP